MTDSINVAVGVVEGKVIARWRNPTSEIVFDPKNAYTVGIHLSRAAMEAHRGSKSPEKDLEFIADELATVKVEVTDVQRLAMVLQVATIIRTLTTEKREPMYIAEHCVDAVLRETAR